MTRLLWVLTDDVAVYRYTAELLCELAGFRCELVSAIPDGGEAFVYHGTRPPPRGAYLWIPSDASGEVPAQMDLRPHEGGWRTEGDVLRAACELLTDAAAQGFDSSAFDRHGRLLSSQSILGQRGMATAPVVNHYVTGLQTAASLLGVGPFMPQWPQGRRAAIGLSHDVDRPEKYAGIHALTRGRLPRPRLLPWFLARAAYEAFASVRDQARDEYWLFEELMSLEASFGFRSSLLFAVEPAYGRHGSRFDVLYDVRGTRYPSLLKSLRERGFEVGLHASYNAFARPDRFASERRHLEELSGGRVSGVRHHYWHVGPDVERTLRGHESAGLLYDSSLAFNDAIGLRRGIALPYRPWDSSEQRRLACWQLPVLALDSAACAGPEPLEAKVERLWSAIEHVIEANGFAALDWHLRCSAGSTARFGEWARIYSCLLERLASRPDVWTTRLQDVASWMENRAAAL